MRFAKGHGTGNDFVILPDLDDRLELTPALVRQVCDRHNGIGADGILRVVPGEAAAAAGLARPADAGAWFMDYRNADGGIAEMCGNGIRVFARYLTDHGLAGAGNAELAIGTRSGLRRVWREDDGVFSVDMGPARVTGKATAVIGGESYRGLGVDVGNPHLACLVSSPVAAFDLSRAPEVDALDFPNGVNVELVRVTGDRAIEMRVRERGSGETLSCGTGAVAAAVAAAEAAGRWQGGGPDYATDRWRVLVPGGTLTVAPSASASVLVGPAVIVAEGEIDPRWLIEAEG